MKNNIHYNLEFQKQLLEDLKTIKSIIKKYEHFFEIKNIVEDSNQKLRLKDILTDQEKIKVNELRVKMLTSETKKESDLIRYEIELIFEEAKKRYYRKIEQG